MTRVSSILLLSLLALPGVAACGVMGTGALVPEVEGDPVAREAALRERIEREGGDPEAWAELAVIRLEQGQPVAARSLVGRALALDDAHPRALAVAARVANRAGEPELALNHLDRLVAFGYRSAVAPELADTLLAVARRRIEGEELELAASALARLKRELPNETGERRKQLTEAYLQLAEAWVTNGDVEQVVETLTRAREAGADDGALILAEARARLQVDQPGRAAELFSRWVSRGPAGERWSEVGRAWAANRYYSQALTAYREAVAASPEVASYRWSLAEVALDAEEVPIASAALREWAALPAPEGEPPRSRAERLAAAGDLLRIKGYGSEAVDFLEEAFEASPESWPAAELLASLLARKSRWDDISAVAARYVAAHDGELSATLDAAHMLRRLSMTDAAIALMEKGAERHPDAAELLLDLVAYHDEKGHPQARARWLAAYEQAVGSDPAGKAAAGRAYLRYGEVARAAELAREALEASPTELDATLLMADVHDTRGEAAKAVAVLRQMVASAPDQALAALKVGERYAAMELSSHAGAINRQRAHRWLTEALNSKDNDVLRAAHSALAELHMRRARFDVERVSQHVRAWLALAPPEERKAALLEAEERVAGKLDLRGLRIELVEQLAALDPTDRETLGRLGHLYLQAGSGVRAREVFERYVATAPDPERESEQIGWDLLKGRHEAEAAVFFSRVEPEHLRHTEGHLRLAQLFDGLGQRKRALRHYRLHLNRELSRPPKERSGLRSLAKTLNARRYHDLAARAFEGVLEDQPDDREAKVGLGSSLVALGRVHEARPYLDAFLASTAGRKASALETVGDIYHDHDLLRDAARVYEAKLRAETRPYSSPTFVEVTDLYRKLGDRQGLERVAETLIKASGRSPRHRGQAYLKAAEALENAGMLDEASALLARASQERRTEHRELALRRARNALARGDVAAAVRQYRRWVEITSGQAESWQRAARELRDGGAPRAAVELLGEALQSPEAPAALSIVRGRLHLDLGAIDSAHEDFVTSLTRSLSLASIMREIEESYRNAGQLERLRDIYTRAVALSPSRSEHHLGLGRVLLDLGEPAEARQALARYLSLNERGQVNVARAYAEAGYPAEALAHYAQVNERSATVDELRTFTEVADLLMDQGRGGELDALVRRFLVSRTADAKALRAVAEVWEKAGEPALAAEWLRRAQELSQSPEELFALGSLLSAMGEDDESEQVFERFLALRGEPDRKADVTKLAAIEKAAGELVALYLARGNRPAALSLVQRLQERLGARPWSVITLARLRVLDGRVREAMLLLRSHEALLPHAAAEEVIELTAALLVRQRVGEALTVITAARSQAPRPKLELVELSLRARRGLPEDMRGWGEDLLLDQGERAAAGLGEILYDEGRLDLAEVMLRRAVEQGPVALAAGAAIRLHKVRALRGSGKPGEVAGLLDALAGGREDRVGLAVARSSLLMALGRPAEALEAADAGLALEPGNATLFQRALGAAAMSDDSRAVLERIARYRPAGQARAAVLASTATTLERMERPDLALTVVEQLLELSRADPAQRLRAVRLALASGDEVRASTHAALYADVMDPDAGGLLDLAEIYLEYSYPNEAARYLEEADRGGDRLRSRRQRLLARLALAGGRWEQARQALDASVEAARDRSAARRAAARICLDLGGPPAYVRETLLPPLLKSPRPPLRSLDLAARASWRAGDTEAARGYYGQLVRRFPRHPERDPGLSLALVREAARAGDIESVGAIAGAARRGGRHEDAGDVALRLVSRVLEEEGDRMAASARHELVDLAEGLLLEASRSAPEWERWYAAAVADVAEARNGPDAALRVLDNALAKRPDNPANANNLAYYLARRELHLDRALRLIRRAELREAMPNSSYLDTEAWVLHELGRSREALPLIRYALLLSGQARARTGGERVELLYHLAEIHWALGHHDVARAAFRRCARVDPGDRGGYSARCALALKAR